MGRASRLALAKGAGETLLIAAAYYAAARVGQLVAIPPGNVTAVWPPSGIALVAVLLYGARIWPGIWLGAFFGNIWPLFDGSSAVAVAAAIGVGSVLQPLLGASLLRHAGFRPSLEHAKDAFKLAGAAALMCLVSCTIGATSLCAGGFADWSAFGTTWLTWWMGDTVGVIVVAPLLLTWRARPAPASRSRRLQAGILFGLLVAACAFVFGRWIPPRLSRAFFLIPILAWAGLRLSPGDMAKAVVLVAVISVCGTVRGFGPFAQGPFNERLLLLQAFLGLVGVTSLAMSAVVTERRRAEDDLRKSQSELRLQMTRMPIGCIVWSPEFRVVSWNPAAEKIFGFTSEDATGKHPYDLIVPKSAQPQVDAVWNRLLEGDDTAHSENENITKDGRTIVCAWTNTPLKDAGGRVAGVLSMTRDVTERKRAEEEREAVVEFLHTASGSTGTRELIERAVTSFRHRWGFEAVGVRLRQGDDYPYYETRGFPDEFVLLENSLCARDDHGEVIRDDAGQPVLECMCGNVICGRFDPSKPFFTPGGSFWTNSTTDLLAGTTESDRQSRTRNRCHGEGYESVALIPLRFGEQRLGLIQLNDRRKGMFTPELIALLERLAGYLAVSLAKFGAEEEVRKVNAELEQRVRERTADLNAANKELEAFSYSVSHDLRSPLLSIDGFSQALLEDCADKLDEQGRDYLSRVRAAAQRMSRLIDDLLRLSRSVRADMNKETVDLSAMVRSIAANLTLRDAARSVEFVIADGISVHGDPTLLQVVLENLLDNAWKFTARESHARIEFGERPAAEVAAQSAAGAHAARQPKHPDTACFVRDNGVGFDMRYAGELFSAFHRLHGASEFAGNGIGLATVQRIMLRHGGRIWPEAEVGKGATFYFTL